MTARQKDGRRQSVPRGEQPQREIEHACDRLDSLCVRLERLRREGEELVASGGWHRGDVDALARWGDQAVSTLGEELVEIEWINPVLRAATAEARPGAKVICSQAFDKLSGLVRVAARLEQLLEAVGAGPAFSDPTGVATNAWLRDLGLRSIDARAREASWSVLEANVRRDPHRDWDDPVADAPAPIWRRLRDEIFTAARRLRVMYGKDDESLGTEDRSEFEVDHRAASRLRKKAAWIRATRQLGEGGEDLPAHLAVPMGDPVSQGAVELVFLEGLARDDRERLMCRLIASGASPTEAAREAGLSRSAFRAFQARARRRSA